MRHTRIRQLKKLGKNYRVANRTIHRTRGKQYDDELDHTFKWHREEGCVSFSEKILGRTFATEVTIHKKQPMKLF